MRTEEKWEVIIGGNFVQVWQESKYEPADSLTYEEGAVCDLKLPNIDKKGITYGKAMEIVMPRARLIVAATNAAREINPENPIAAAEAMPEIFRLLQDAVADAFKVTHKRLDPGKWLNEANAAILKALEREGR